MSGGHTANHGAAASAPPTRHSGLLTSPWLTTLRFVVLLAGLTVVATYWGPELVERLLPSLRTELAWLDDTYTVQTLRRDKVGADQVILLEVSQARSIILDGHVFMPDARGRAKASTLMSHVFLAAVLLASVALAAPLADPGPGAWRRQGGALLLRLPLVAVAVLAVLAVDVPMVLWGSIWSLHVEFAQPDRFSPLLIWRTFLEGGGRLALGVGLGALVAWISYRRAPR